MPSQRPHPTTERPLDAPLLTFDVSTLITQIKSEDTWKKGSRNGITLLKGQGLRVVLVAIRAGTAIPSHRADGPLSLQVVEGRIKFSAASQEVTLGEGQVLTLQAGIPHSVEALRESAFLLTLVAETPSPAEAQP